MGTPDITPGMAVKAIDMVPGKGDACRPFNG